MVGVRQSKESLPLISLSFTCVCSGSLSLLFTLLSLLLFNTSGPCSDLMTFLSKAVPNHSSKTPFFYFWLSACCPAERARELESEGNLSGAARREGDTLKRSLTETSSVLLWQRSYFWPCFDWQTANLSVCVHVSTAEAASSEAPPSARWLVRHRTPSSTWERERERR